MMKEGKNAYFDMGISKENKGAILIETVLTYQA
jgi:hypothetical protein